MRGWIFRSLKRLKLPQIGLLVTERQCLVDCVFAHHEPISNLDWLTYEQVSRVVKGSSIRASKQGCIPIQIEQGHLSMDGGIQGQRHANRCGHGGL